MSQANRKYYKLQFKIFTLMFLHSIKYIKFVLIKLLHNTNIKQSSFIKVFFNQN